MKAVTFNAWASALATGLLISAVSGTAWAQSQESSARFAEPVRLETEEGLLGENRLYPSPALQDMNGDGKLDIVIADLFGHVTVAHRQADAEGIVFGAEQKMLNDKGKELKFENW